MSDHNSLIGRRFGRLLVLSRTDRVGKENKLKWLCRCDCGVEKRIQRYNLISGASSSCGCFQREFHTTHGMYKMPHYETWKGMIQRCHNPNSADYYLYGARGIRVCERWRDFKAFHADMGERPGQEFSLEREDNDGDYEPANCRWATATEQAKHRRRPKHNTSGVTGVTWDSEKRKWLANIGVSRKTIFLGRFSNIEDAAAVRKDAERKFGFHPSHGEGQ